MILFILITTIITTLGVNTAPLSQRITLPQATIDQLDKQWITLDTFLKKNGEAKGLSVLGKPEFTWQQWGQVMSGLEKTLLKQTGMNLDSLIEFQKNVTTSVVGRGLTVEKAAGFLMKQVEFLKVFLKDNEMPSLREMGVNGLSQEKIAVKLKDLEMEIVDLTGIDLFGNDRRSIKNLLEEITVVNQLVQKSGKQLKVNSIATKLKELNEMVFDKTGLSSDAIEAMAQLGKNIGESVVSLSVDTMDRFEELDQLMIKSGQPSLKLIPGVLQFGENRMNIFLISLADKIREETGLSLNNIVQSLNATVVGRMPFPSGFKSNVNFAKISNLTTQTLLYQTRVFKLNKFLNDTIESTDRNNSSLIGQLTEMQTFFNTDNTTDISIGEQFVQTDEYFRLVFGNFSTSQDLKVILVKLEMERVVGEVLRELKEFKEGDDDEMDVKVRELKVELGKLGDMGMEEIMGVIHELSTFEKLVKGGSEAVRELILKLSEKMESLNGKRIGVMKSVLVNSTVETTTLEATTMEANTTTPIETTTTLKEAEETTLETISFNTTLNSTTAETIILETTTLEPTTLQTTTLEEATILEASTQEITTLESTTLETSTVAATTLQSTTLQTTTLEEATTLESTTLETSTLEQKKETTLKTTTLETSTLMPTTLETSTLELTTTSEATTTVEASTLQTTTLKEEKENTTLASTTVESTTTLETTTLQLTTTLETTTLGELTALETFSLNNSTLPTLENTTLNTTTQETIILQSTTIEPTQNTTTQNPLSSQMTYQLESTTTLSPHIQFEIKNYTVVSHNSSIPNTYSLRIRIKGYKWNNNYTNVNSLEARRLLQQKILPLLYKHLNLIPSEIKQVKLLKLFKGRRSSSQSLQLPNNLTDRTNNEDNDIVFDFQIERAIKNSPVSFKLQYTGLLMATTDHFDLNFLNNTLESMFKQAVLKHFDGRLEHLQIKVVKIGKSNEFPVQFELEMNGPVMLVVQDVSKAISEMAVERENCQVLRNVTRGIVCKGGESASLFRIGDLWLELQMGMPQHSKLHSLKDLFSFNSAWVFGLIIIACILALFFVGCIFAICYTRKPYRKPSKVYDMDTAGYNNKVGHHKLPNTITTKKQIVPRHKEVYY